MKKQFALLTAVIMTVSMLGAGCSTTKNPAGSSQGTSSEKSIYTPVGQYPIVNEKITLTVFTVQDPQILDLKTNTFTKFMEDKTNINLEFQTAPSDAMKEKLNLIMSAGGELPDVFLGIGLDDSKYGVDQKLLAPLNSIIDTQMPNFKKFMDSQSGLKTVITSTDGNIYGLPTWNDCYHCKNQQKMWINKALLDKYGLEMPTTTDEFYQMLKAYKKANPKGIALAGSTDGWNANIDTFLMNSFIYDSGVISNERLFLSVKDKKIDTSINKPAYKEGLAYLNKLYKEGLIDSGSFTQKNAQLKQLIVSPGEPVLCTPDGASISFVDPATSQEVYKNYVSLAPLKGPTGLQQSSYFKYASTSPMAYVISKDCKYPEAAARWADYNYSFEGALNQQLGPKGDTTWRDATSGEVGLNGKAAIYKQIWQGGTTAQNLNWTNSGFLFAPEELKLGAATDPNVDITKIEGLEKFLYDETATKYAPYESKDYEVLPPLKLLPDESQQLQTVVVELDKYILESRTRFIMGNLSLDKDWDKYVESLDNIGMQKLIAANQKAYDRQNAKN